MQCHGDACGIAVHVPGAADGVVARESGGKAKLQWSQGCGTQLLIH